MLDTREAKRSDVTPVLKKFNNIMIVMIEICIDFQGSTGAGYTSGCRSKISV